MANRIEWNGMENQIQCDTLTQKKEKLRHLISLKQSWSVALCFFFFVAFSATEWLDNNKNNNSKRS